MKKKNLSGEAFLPNHKHSSKHPPLRPEYSATMKNIRPNLQWTRQYRTVPTPLLVYLLPPPLLSCETSSTTSDVLSRRATRTRRSQKRKTPRSAQTLPLLSARHFLPY